MCYMKQNMLCLCIYVHLYLFYYFAAWQLIRCVITLMLFQDLSSARSKSSCTN